MMLSEEQLAVLPVRARIQGELAGHVMNGGVAGDEDIAREVLYLTTGWATALLRNQRDRARCRWALHKARIERDSAQDWYGVVVAQGEVEIARQLDRRRLRAVLARAKELRLDAYINGEHEKYWREKWTALMNEFDAARRSATAWKAAAKKWYITKPLRGAQKQIIAELQAECDELRRRLRAVLAMARRYRSRADNFREKRETELAQWTSATEGIIAERDELRKRGTGWKAAAQDWMKRGTRLETENRELPESWQTCAEAAEARAEAAEARLAELEAVVEAGEALISDVEWRHPEIIEGGFNCQFMADLASAIREYREAQDE
jgi:hypothetical protein